MKNDITTYTFSPSDRLFFDANILIYLDGPIASVNKKLQAIYANAFAKIINAKSEMFVDTVVLSEFANRYLRFAYEPFKKRCAFKDFRNSIDGKKTISSICNIIKKRLKYFSLPGSQIGTAMILGVVNEFDKLSGDFNDCIIADICRRNAFSLITHDGDMGSFGVPIISANLRLCP